MKRHKWMLIIAIALLVLQIFAYLNLCVSDKYEVSLLRTHVSLSKDSEQKKEKLLQAINNREREILRQKNILIVSSTLTFITIVFIVVVSGSRHKT